MSNKSKRHRENHKTENHLLDEDRIEQRALQIARDEGRSTISEEDRARASEELLAPNEVMAEPELSPGMSAEVVAWDEAPGSTGRRVERVEPEDENSIGKSLVENGLRGPRHPRNTRETRLDDVNVDGE